MTISSEVCSVRYPGNDVTTNWIYNFLVPGDSAGHAEVFVVLTDLTGAVSFIDPADYIVTGIGNPLGGTVVYPTAGSPLAAGTYLSIIRGQPYTQLIAVADQRFYPHTVEELADLLTMQTQQLNERASRALTVPPGESLTFVPSLNVRKNKVLGFDAAGLPMMYSPGGGGPGSNNWDDLIGVPLTISTLAAATPAAGKIWEYTGPSSGHLINTPSGTVSSVNGFIGAVVLSYADVGAAATVHTHVYTDVTNFGFGVNAKLLPGTNVTFSYNGGTQVTTINATGGGGGGMQPQLMSNFAAIDGGGVNTANNDTAITAAEANAESNFYWPDGTYKTTLASNSLGKGYIGRGKLLFGASLFPAKYSYALTKPTPAGTGTGTSGFFSGDMKFGDGGEYKIIGPNIRTYDLTSQYYQPTLMPHFAWFDSLSGNSGCNAFITNDTVGGGSTAVTVRLNNLPDAAWVGKDCIISCSFNGAAIETKTIASINTGTKEITFTTGVGATFTGSITAGVLTVTAISYGVLGTGQSLQGGAIVADTWISGQLTGSTGGTGTYSVLGTTTLASSSLRAGYALVSGPAGSGFNSRPNIRFAPRTWNGQTYIKVKAAGGGDTYGHIVRTTMEYVPKSTETAHTFMTGTVGQYGGDVNFISGSDGTYATSTEFAAYDQGNDVAYIAHVGSFARQNDRGGIGLPLGAGGGRVWLGLRFQSSNRAADVALGVAGSWRYALDTAQSFLKESTVTQDPHFIGNTTITAYSNNGAVVGRGVTISSPGIASYTGTIVSILASGGFTVTPALAQNYPANSYVEFIGGGAIVNAALGQKMIWNSKALNYADGSLPNVGLLRGTDPTELFPPFWGNQQGDIETGTDTDVSGDFWYTKFNGRAHSGASARIRLRPTAFQVNVAATFGDVVLATKEVGSSGATFSPGVGGVFSGAFVAGLGTGHYFGFNTSNNRWEFYRAGSLVGTFP